MIDHNILEETTPSVSKITENALYCNFLSKVMVCKPACGQIKQRTGVLHKTIYFGCW